MLTHHQPFLILFSSLKQRSSLNIQSTHSPPYSIRCWLCLDVQLLIKKDNIQQRESRGGYEVAFLVPSIETSPNCCVQRLRLWSVTASKIRKPKRQSLPAVWVSITDGSIKSEDNNVKELLCGKKIISSSRIRYMIVDILR